jgi:hypothetical protein
MNWPMQTLMRMSVNFFRAPPALCVASIVAERSPLENLLEKLFSAIAQRRKRNSAA